MKIMNLFVQKITVNFKPASIKTNKLHFNHNHHKIKSHGSI
jgi:hypothetical protein